MEREGGARVTRHWWLPADGQVFVQVGDRVKPGDLLARGPMMVHVRAVDIARTLGCEARDLLRVVAVRSGDRVKAGDVVARGRRGLLGRTAVRAPVDGDVLGVAGGCLFLQERRLDRCLVATLAGDVVEVAEGRGVIVDTVALHIRGAWGSGGECRGPITPVVGEPGSVLTSRQIAPRHRGAVLVAGMLEDWRAVVRARNLHVCGIIVGSVPMALCDSLRDARIPVVVTEGFGQRPMAPAVWQALRRYEGRPAALVGASAWPGEEASLYVPIDPDAVPTRVEAGVCGAGAWVRLTGGNALGQQGQVISPAPVWDRTPLGAWYEGFEVRLASGRRVFVPLTNLEPVP